MTAAIITVALFGALFGGIFFWVRRAGLIGKRQRAALAARRASARPGRARVVAARSVQGGGSIDGAVTVSTRVHLTLDIETPGGVVRGEAAWDVSDVLKLQQLAEGAQIDVLVDRVDPRFVFPAAPWARQSAYDPLWAALWDAAKSGSL